MPPKPSLSGPNPGTLFPLENINRVCFLKNLVSNPKIIVGDYTYYDDFENIDNFEKNVKYHFDFTGDKLIIGKFCMIASGVEFIMNGGNHHTAGISTYPFEIFGTGWEGAMEGRDYPYRGDTIIGNDVWIGYKAVIMPGVKIGDGAIIASHAFVTQNVKPYSIVGGNPAQMLMMRFTPEQIKDLLSIKWWDWDPEKITRNLKLLTGNDIEALKNAR